MLHIHTGRGKAGSTTIQRFVLANRAALEAQGVIYPPLRRGQSRHADIKFAVRSPTADQQALDALREQVGARPDLTFVVSDEGMFHKTAPDLSRARKLVDVPGGVQILVYIREYGDWIASVYGQATKTANNSLDFDAYHAQQGHRMSIMPHLELCAELVGWDRIRVRSLDRSALHGGSLIADFVAAVGLPDPAELTTDLSDQNIAPSWMAVEFRRALTHCFGHDKTPHRPAIKSLVRRFGAVLAEHGAETARAVYLTSQQAADARALYNADVAAINAHTGAGIPGAPARAAVERPFLPALEHVPAPIRHAVAGGLTERYRRRLPPPARERLQRLVTLLEA